MFPEDLSKVDLESQKERQDEVKTIFTLIRTCNFINDKYIQLYIQEVLGILKKKERGTLTKHTLVKMKKAKYTHVPSKMQIHSQKCLIRQFHRFANIECTYTQSWVIQPTTNLGYTAQAAAPRLQTYTACYYAKQHQIKLSPK